MVAETNEPGQRFGPRARRMTKPYPAGKSARAYGRGRVRVAGGAPPGADTGPAVAMSAGPVLFCAGSRYFTSSTVATAPPICGIVAEILSTRRVAVSIHTV
jgi:hypothetical protein